MPIRLSEPQAQLFASLLSEARTQSVAEMAFKKDAVRLGVWQSEYGPSVPHVPDEDA